MAEKTVQKNLLVFDFDWSLVNENSDIYIFKQLAPGIVDEIREEYSSKTIWTELIDNKLVKLQKVHGVTPSDIGMTIAGIPVLEGMRKVLETARSLGSYIAIASDANELFIRSFLEQNGLTGLVDEIHTNTSPMVEGVLRVEPYTPKGTPHNCDLCSLNQCKGAILDGLVAKLLKQGNAEEEAEVRIIYVGDGGNDFCPGTRMNPGDVLCVRYDDNYKQAQGLYKRLHKKNNLQKVASEIVYWKIMKEIEDAIKSTFTK